MASPPVQVDDAKAGLTSSAQEALDRIRGRLVRPMPSDGIWGWLLPLAITVLGGILRFWRITRPGGHSLTNKSSIVFDETYYAHDSWSLLHHGVETDGLMKSSAFVVHPPLGKWMMAVGEAIFDHGKSVTFHQTVYPASPLSFRFMGALLGTLAILITARVARRMFRSTALGVVAGTLVALDGLEFVQSRTATLDIYLLFWVIAAFGCLVVDRDWGRRRLAERLVAPLGDREWGPRIGFRPWRWGAALCLGAAMATKWNGLYYIPAFILLAFAWDVGARRTAGARGGSRIPLATAGPILRRTAANVRIFIRRTWMLRNAGGRLLLPLLALFVLVPAIVYLASWTGWFLSNGHYAYDHDLYVHPGQSWLAHDWAVLRGWWHYNRVDIWNYDKTLHASHPYLSKPWGWLLLARPVAYYYQTPAGCGSTSCAQEILGIGNPAIWWATIPALIVVLAVWIGRRDWRAAGLVTTFAFGYVPWIVQELPIVHTTPPCTPAGDCHRTMFLYYMLPNVPFMALLLTMTIGLLLGRRSQSEVRRGIGAAATAAYLAVVVSLFYFFYPVLAARNIPQSEWHRRIWFTHSCDAGNRNQHHENAPCWI
ncbi:MAG TPA: phospholipid carrier-dependent glycosyltransferase [Mycobacteriales bacterium]|nr:phospholipid carrier-dependent glycosyltransferase [Mycobacteriales bacterium]